MKKIVNFCQKQLELNKYKRKIPLIFPKSTKNMTNKRENPQATADRSRTYRARYDDMPVDCGYLSPLRSICKKHVITLTRVGVSYSPRKLYS